MNSKFQSDQSAIDPFHQALRLHNEVDTNISISSEPVNVRIKGDFVLPQCVKTVRFLGFLADEETKLSYRETREGIQDVLHTFSRFSNTSTRPL